MNLGTPLSKILYDNTSGSSAILNQLASYLTDPDNESTWKQCAEDAIKFGLKELFSFQIVTHFLTSLEKELPAINSARELTDWVSKYESQWSILSAKWLSILTEIFTQKEIAISTHSQSESMKSVLYDLSKSGKKVKVIQSQSSPANEGELQANWLANKGIEVVLTTDALAPGFVKDVDTVLLGCDGIYKDGFVNKAGSFGLCLAASHFKKPVYVMADTRKISHEMAVKEKSRPAMEVSSRAHPNLEIYNRYFELIPHNLVTGYITEKGTLEENI